MGKYYRVKPKEIKISSPNGIYITNEEQIKAAVMLLLTSAYVLVLFLVKRKITRIIKNRKRKHG